MALEAAASFDGGVTAACIAASSAETVDRGMQGLDSILESDSGSEDCKELDIGDTGQLHNSKRWYLCQ